MTDRNFRTVLIVSPSLIDQRRLGGAMRRLGFQRVLEASGGRQAVTVLAEELVDLVLTPWDTADLSGVELLRALRRRGQNRNVPVVILDDGLSQQTIVSTVKAGAAGRVKVPADPAKIADVLKTIAEVGHGRTAPPKPPPGS